MHRSMSEGTLRPSISEQPASSSPPLASPGTGGHELLACLLLGTHGLAPILAPMLSCPNLGLIAEARRSSSRPWEKLFLPLLPGIAFRCGRQWFLCTSLHSRFSLADPLGLVT